MNFEASGVSALNNAACILGQFLIQPYIIGCSYSFKSWPEIVPLNFVTVVLINHHNLN